MIWPIWISKDTELWNVFKDMMSLVFSRMLNRFKLTKYFLVGILTRISIVFKMVLSMYLRMLQSHLISFLHLIFISGLARKPFSLQNNLKVNFSPMHSITNSHCTIHDFLLIYGISFPLDLYRNKKKSSENYYNTFAVNIGIC